ncbi:hypothetical protein PQX77_004282 [Marasmius sp. AFHP31]|nr:hypothetical protein PQX77_004282 [Marasmius sp. AFHP31]
MTSSNSNFDFLGGPYNVFDTEQQSPQDCESGYTEQQADYHGVGFDWQFLQNMSFVPSEGCFPEVDFNNLFDSTTAQGHPDLASSSRTSAPIAGPERATAGLSTSTHIPTADTLNPHVNAPCGSNVSQPQDIDFLNGYGGSCFQLPNMQLSCPEQEYLTHPPPAISQLWTQHPPLSWDSPSSSEWSHSDATPENIDDDAAGWSSQQFRSMSPPEVQRHSQLDPFSEESSQQSIALSSLPFKTPIILGWPGPDVDLSTLIPAEAATLSGPKGGRSSSVPSRFSSFRTGLKKGDGHTDVCRWRCRDGPRAGRPCGAVITSASLAAHMNDFHKPFMLSPEDRDTRPCLDDDSVYCEWEGCVRKKDHTPLRIKRGQLNRHIRATHLNCLGKRCPLCNKWLSRPDSYERHLVPCKKEKEKAAEDKGMKNTRKYWL